MRTGLSGGPTFLPEVTTLFLAVGAGAIFLVIYQIGRLILRDTVSRTDTRVLAVGPIAGLAIMYLKGLLIVARRHPYLKKKRSING